ncbi:MAG: zinc-dependent dehydrogenase [Desulfotomaculaceae bacterium]
MKAALLEGIKTLKITEVETPKCKNGEVLIKVGACGLCRTDMKAYNQGQRDLRLPRILGHEITGTVSETGAGVAHFKTGDRVQVSPGLPCGRCFYCLGGLHQMCDSVQIMGFHYDGGFAEYVLVPANGINHGVLNKIPAHLSLQEAALTEPLACSVNMQETARVGLGDVVVIFGAGPLGILNARLARARGAGPVILVEVNEERLASAENRDFDYRVNALTASPVNKIMEMTGGRGADVVIPCCPSPKNIDEGLTMLAKKGRFGFFSGLVQESKAPSPDLNMIHYKELSVFGAYGCSAQHNRTALALLASGAIKVKDMITRIIGLDELLSGLENVAAMKEIKIVMTI